MCTLKCKYWVNLILKYTGSFCTILFSKTYIILLIQQNKLMLSIELHVVAKCDQRQFDLRGFD